MRHVFTILYVLCALFIAGHSTQTLEPLASTAPAEAPVVRIASVAACVTGKLGPLIYPSVYANIQRQILAPLGRPNVDAFGAFELQNRTSNDEAVLSMVDAVNFLAWVPYAAQTTQYCRLRRSSRRPRRKVSRDVVAVTDGGVGGSSGK